MSTLVQNSSSFGSKTHFGNPKKPGFIQRLYQAYKKHAELVEAERKLMALDDRLLDDIGLSRYQVHEVIWRR